MSAPAAEAIPSPAPPSWIPLTRRGWPELVLLAFLHRTVLALWTTTFAADASWYLRASEAFRAGQFREAMDYLHPLFPLLTSLLSLITGDVEKAAVLLSVVSGALLPLPLYLTVKALWNERVAWVTGFLYAIHPILAPETSEALPTALFLLLFFCAAACGVLAYQGNKMYLYPLAGVFAGLCYLTRTEGIQAAVFLSLAAAVAIFRTYRGRAAEATPAPGRLRLAAGVLAAFLSFSIVAAPYVLFIREKTGRWGFTLKGAGQELLQKAIGGPALEGGTPDPSMQPSAEGAGRDAPVRFVGKKLAKAMFGPLVPVYILGFFCSRKQGGRWGSIGLLLLMGFICFIPVTLLLTLAAKYRPGHRYLLLLAILWMPWAAAAILTLGDLLCAGLRSPSARKAVLPSILGLLLILLPLKDLGPRRAHEAVFREVGQWLSQQPIPAPRAILCSSEKPVYYGKCSLVPMAMLYGDPDDIPGRHRSKAQPSQDLSVVREWARQVHETFVKGRAALVVLDDGALKHYDLGAEGLLELEKTGFKRIKVFEPTANGAGLTVWVFALEKS